MYRVKGSNQQEYGPIPQEVLAQWIQEGRVNLQSLICQEGSDNWRPLDSFPELAQLIAQANEAGGGGGGISGGGAFGDPSSDGGRESALATVNMPGIFLILIGVIGLLFGVVGLFTSPESIQQMMQTRSEGMTDAQQEQIEQMILKWGKSAWIFTVIGFLVNGLAVYAGMQLRMLRSYTLVMVATILTMVPCFSGCPACCLSIPLGVWILIVINKPEIRPYFES